MPDDGRPTVEEYANMPSADAFVGAFNFQLPISSTVLVTFNCFTVDRDDGVTFKFEKGQM